MTDSSADIPSPSQRRTTRLYGALLLLAAAIWGLGTVVIKDTVDAFPALWLVGIRFLTAGIIFCLLFSPRLVRLGRAGKLGDHLRAALLLGLLIGGAYLLNTGGLTATTAARSSFLTGTYCVLVPFQTWLVMQRRPSAFNVGAGILCLAGIALMSLPAGDGLAFGVGEAMTLGSAVFLGFHVVATARLAEGRDMVALTALQFVVCGLMGLAVGALAEPAPTAALMGDPAFLGNLAYLVLAATCAALLLQNLGLVHVSPSSGALLLSFESVFGVLFSVLLLGESLTAAMVAGFALIFAAVLTSEWLPDSALLARLRAAHGADDGRADAEAMRAPVAEDAPRPVGSPVPPAAAVPQPRDVLDEALVGDPLAEAR